MRAVQPHFCPQSLSWKICSEHPAMCFQHKASVEIWWLGIQGANSFTKMTSSHAAGMGGGFEARETGDAESEFRKVLRKKRMASTEITQQVRWLGMLPPGAGKSHRLCQVGAGWVRRPTKNSTSQRLNKHQWKARSTTDDQRLAVVILSIWWNSQSQHYPWKSVKWPMRL